MQEFDNVRLTGTYSYLEATYEENGLLFGERSVQARPGMRIPGIPENIFDSELIGRLRYFKNGVTLIATSDLVTQ